MQSHCDGWLVLLLSDWIHPLLVRKGLDGAGGFVDARGCFSSGKRMPGEGRAARDFTSIFLSFFSLFPCVLDSVLSQLGQLAAWVVARPGFEFGSKQPGQTTERKALNREPDHHHESQTTPENESGTGWEDESRG